MSTLIDTRLVFGLEIRAADTTSPRRARRWLGWCLETARVAQDTIDAAVLAMSELVTNAVQHSDSDRVLVSAELVDAGVRLVVHQDVPATDWRQPTGDLAEHGRGLLIVAALAEQLEAATHPGGTTVSALIAHAGTADR